MNTNNGTIEVNGVQITQEQAVAAMNSIKAVNLGEVVAEIIPVTVYFYKEEPIQDDEGNDFLDGDGKPYVRRVPKTRTARIQNKMSLDTYHRASSLSGRDFKEQVVMDAVKDIVLEVWQNSEPFMTREMLIAGVEGERIIALFGHFLDKANQFQVKA